MGVQSASRMLSWYVLNKQVQSTSATIGGQQVQQLVGVQSFSGTAGAYKVSKCSSQ